MSSLFSAGAPFSKHATVRGLYGERMSSKYPLHPELSLLLVAKLPATLLQRVFCSFKIPHSSFLKLSSIIQIGRE